MVNVVQINPNILGGTPVFTGTRVPIEVFLDHIKAGVSIEDFILDFPTVTKEQCNLVLEMANFPLPPHDKAC